MSGHSRYLSNLDSQTPIRRSAEATGRFSKSPIERDVLASTGPNPEDPIMKKVYGQYLKDQVMLVSENKNVFIVADESK